MQKQELESGDLVQLSPYVANPMFAFCFMVITELKEWGAQGYVQSLGKNGEPGGQAYCRAKWDEMELVGRAKWMAR